MTIADTSGLLALFNQREPEHGLIRQLVDDLKTPLVVSPYVIAELDYLVATRMGVEAELQVLKELAGGAYDLAQLTADDLQSCIETIDRYSDQEIGIADASIVVLADRYDTNDILTLDRRHFNVLRPLAGDHFILPSSVS
ncbi:MAG: VapC toxin family PIN domain ribonuclease [Acidimicrobiales bacterium]